MSSSTLLFCLASTILLILRTKHLLEEHRANSHCMEIHSVAGYTAVRTDCHNFLKILGQQKFFQYLRKSYLAKPTVVSIPSLLCPDLSTIPHDTRFREQSHSNAKLKNEGGNQEKNKRESLKNQPKAVKTKNSLFLFLKKKKKS